MRIPWLQIALFAWIASAQACVVVEGDRIRGRDLAAANSIFAGIDGAAEIGLAPRPGVTRAFHREDLLAVARRYHMEAPPQLDEVCFVRAAMKPAAGEPAAGSRRASEMDVSRGEDVAVEVHSGGAMIAFASRAESSGRSGDAVLVRNPDNGRLFQARVAGKGRAVIQK